MCHLISAVLTAVPSLHPLWSAHIYMDYYRRLSSCPQWPLLMQTKHISTKEHRVSTKEFQGQCHISTECPTFVEGFWVVEKSVYVCGRFTLVGGFTFDGVTPPLSPTIFLFLVIEKSSSYLICNGLKLVIHVDETCIIILTSKEEDGETCTAA